MMPLHVEVECSQCGAKRKYKRKTWLEYVRKSIKFLCKPCATSNNAMKGREKITGTCSQCGEPYEAQRNMYVWKERQGKPHYCPKCAHEITGRAVTERNVKYWKRRNPEGTAPKELIIGQANNVFDAPCGRRIKNTIRNRRNTDCHVCNMKDAGYEICLSIAGDRLWDGWAFDKTNLS